MAFESIFRYAVATLLISAGTAKLSKPTRLAYVIEPYAAGLRMAFRARVMLAAGLSVSVFEVLAGAAVALTPLAAYGLIAAALLFAAFAVVTLLMLRRHEVINCNCLGSIFSIRHDRSAVWLNAAIAGGCAIDAVAISNRLGSDSLGATDIAALGLAGVLGAVLYWTVLFVRSAIVNMDQSPEMFVDQA